MKPVQYAIAACALVTVAACGSESSSFKAKCDVDSTFEQVQQQIFEGRGCTASACHGEQLQGGLDLRASAAYDSLVNIEANSGDYMRVFPGDQELSLLYQKVAAKTEDFELGPLGISGGTMPTGNGALSDDDLGLLRVWIRGGAPESGIVEGSTVQTKHGPVTTSRPTMPASPLSTPRWGFFSTLSSATVNGTTRLS